MVNRRVTNARGVVGVAAWIAGASLLSIVAVCQDTSPWLWGPHLGATGTSAVALSWETTRTVSIDVQYATAETYTATGDWTETFTLDNQTGPVEVWLTELLAGTEYRYRLVAYDGDAVYPTAVGTLRPPSADVTSFSFVVYGETATSVERHRLVAQTVAEEEDPLFVAHVGDFVVSPSTMTYTTFLQAFDPLARSHPVVSTVAHDGSPLYYSMLALPTGGGDSNEQWWTMAVGRVCCIGLDSTIDPEEEPITWEEQIVWLRHLLATKTKEDIIVVFCSDPLYSASYFSATNEPLRQAWESLFVEYDVDAVFTGGTAGGYEHTFNKGIHYFATGGGGSVFEASPNRVAPGTVFRRYGLLHYMRVIVSETEMHIEAIPIATALDGGLFFVPSTASIDTVMLGRSNQEE